MFKMKRKPPKPYRKSEIIEKYFCEPTVSELLTYLKEINVHPDNAHLEVVGNDNWGYSIYMFYTVYESDEEYNKRFELWQKKIEEYEKWNEAHREEIALAKMKEQSRKRLKEKLKEVETALKCICKEDCDVSCKGECGCQFCHNAYQDFLSVE